MSTTVFAQNSPNAPNPQDDQSELPGFYQQGSDYSEVADNPEGQEPAPHPYLVGERNEPKRQLYRSFLYGYGGVRLGFSPIGIGNSDWGLDAKSGIGYNIEGAGVLMLVPNQVMAYGLKFGGSFNSFNTIYNQGLSALGSSSGTVFLGFDYGFKRMFFSFDLHFGFGRFEIADDFQDIAMGNYWLLIPRVTFSVAVIDWARIDFYASYHHNFTDCFYRHNVLLGVGVSFGNFFGKRSLG